MPLVGLGSLLDDARAHGYGILAANVILIEHAEAFVAAADTERAPVVLQISQNAVRYHGGRLDGIGLACRAIAEAASSPVALHLDHATTEDLCRAAADLGFGSVMFDASASHEAENAARTAAVVEWAHAIDLAVEAEIGIVGGKDGRHAVAALTEPEEAKRFAEATGVDALAVQVGTSHAQTTRVGRLDLERIARIRDAVAVPLVLHGSSGIADEQLAAGIEHGLVKINVGTRFNVAFTGAVRDHLATDTTVVDPRRYVGAGRSAVTEAAAGLLRLFGANERG